MKKKAKNHRSQSISCQVPEVLEQRALSQLSLKIGNKGPSQNMHYTKYQYPDCYRG